MPSYSYMRFKELLEKHVITAAHVARETGLSENVFSNWKKRSGNLTVESLAKVSKFFGVPMEYFIDLDHEYADIKTKVKEYAAKRGIPIIQLEKECGLSNGAIHHWDEVMPGVDSVIKIARVLGVTVEELAGGDYRCQKSMNQNMIEK